MQRKWTLLNCTPIIRQFFRSSNQGTPSDGNIYAGENGGYAKSGPLPTVDMVTEQQLGAVGGEAIPTYSTVDKSKKKDKKKDKKAAEQREMENQYAAVDKTKKKKKKKNEMDDTYAEVDMSKKSKKVCWPMIVFAVVIFLVTQLVCLYLFCFSRLQTALVCPLFLLTSIPLKLKLLQFPPIDSLVFCGFILSQGIKFQWLFISFYMRDLGVMWYVMLLEL